MVREAVPEREILAGKYLIVAPLGEGDDESVTHAGDYEDRWAASLTDYELESERQH